MGSDGIGVSHCVRMRIERKGVRLEFTIVLLIGCCVMDLDKEDKYEMKRRLGAGYRRE